MPEEEIEVQITLLGGEPGAPPELFRALVQEGLPPYEERAVPTEVPALAIGAAIGALPKIVEIVLRWAGKDRKRRARLSVGSATIELDQATAEERRELINAFIRSIEGQRRKSSGRK